MNTFTADVLMSMAQLDKIVDRFKDAPTIAPDELIPFTAIALRPFKVEGRNILIYGSERTSIRMVYDHTEDGQGYIHATFTGNVIELTLTENLVGDRVADAIRNLPEFKVAYEKAYDDLHNKMAKLATKKKAALEQEGTEMNIESKPVKTSEVPEHIRNSVKKTEPKAEVKETPKGKTTWREAFMRTNDVVIVTAAVSSVLMNATHKYPKANAFFKGATAMALGITVAQTVYNKFK